MNDATPLESRSAGNAIFQLRNFAFLGLVVLLILLSLALTVYRLTLPSDGWSYARDATGAAQRLVLGDNLSRRPTALQSGDLMLAIEGRPMSKILADALAVDPQPPATWTAGKTVSYTIERRGRQMTVEVVLARLPLFRILASFAQYHLMNPAPLITLLIAFFVFFKQPANTSARLLLLFCGAFFASDGISQAVTGTNVIGPAEMFDTRAFWPSQFINSLIWPLIIAPVFLHLLLSLQIFRAPLRRYPRLRLLLLYGYAPALTLFAAAIYSGRPLEFWRAWSAFSFIDFFAVLLAVIAGIIHSLATNRQSADGARIRWLAWGIIITTLGALGGSVLVSLGSTSGNFFLAWIATRLLLLGFPISVAISILRYRLFDIDIVIRRTLVYGILTAALALIYLASVIVLQAALRLFSGNTGSELVTVFSTLAIAGLFIPLRQRVQNFIDRSFYRGKYNADRALEAFSAGLHHQVELEQISDRIMAIVATTIQPEHVSLWLVKPKN